MTRLAASIPPRTPPDTNQMVTAMNPACQHTCCASLCVNASNSPPMACGDCPVKLPRPDSTT